jgi:hypothetical protein
MRSVRGPCLAGAWDKLPHLSPSGLSCCVDAYENKLVHNALRTRKFVIVGT